MKRNNLTLIIDGNWLMMSRLSVLMNSHNDMKSLCNDLNLLMLKSIKIVLKQFSDIDNIIFVSDGGSWRNSLDIPEFLNHDELGSLVEYKGTREKDESFDWESLFNSFDDFVALLNVNGITTSRIESIEGDDWCYHWTKLLNENNINCIIWSKDADLQQLVHTDNNSCFTIWWNKQSGIVAEEVDNNDFDFLFNPLYATNNTILNNVIKSAKTIKYINPKEIVIDKIVRGDMGDNIFPIITKKSKNNTKTYRVTHKELDLSLDYKDDDKIKEYIDGLLSLKKYKEITKPEEDIIEHFKYNRMLVCLDEEYYPDSVKEIFENNSNYNVSTNIDEIENILNAKQNELTNILEFI